MHGRKIGVLVVVASLGMGGCAAPPPKPYKLPVVVNTTPPTCSTQKDCELMWVNAQEWLGTITRMRLRIVTDSRLETFAATDFQHMSGTVLKYPLANGSYELRIALQCYREDGIRECADLKANATNIFNTAVRSPEIAR